MVKGKIKYCPAPVINEIEDIKKEHGLFHDSEAFIKAVKYCQVGREAERISKLNFRWPPTPPVKEKRKRNRRWP